MKAQSLRGRCTFEMRASSCEEHIQRRVLPQPRRPYVLRRLGSAQKVYHRVRLGQPGGGGGGAAPVAAGARDAARLARAGGAAGRSRVGGDALLGVVARSADGRWLPGGGGSPAAGEADLSCALQDGPRGCPQVGRPAAHGSPPGDLDPGCRDAGAADGVARAGLGGADADAGQGPHPGLPRGGERAGAGERSVQPRRPGVARDGGVATGGAPAGRSAGGFGGAPRCPDCRTRSGSAGARPGDTPEAALLQTIPGIGPFGALLLLAEIGTIARFGSSHELAAYAGLVPSTRSSGGKTAHGSVGPAGSAWLKWLFVEAVQTLKRQPGPVRSQYERLLRAKGKPKATVAAARKLCCYVYWMMKEGRSYDEWLRQRHQREVRPIQAVASVA